MLYKRVETFCYTPFFSYLCKIKRKEEGVLATPADINDDLTHPPGFSRVRASPARHILDTTSFIFALWSRPWGVARLLGVREISHYPNPSEEVG